MQLPTATTLLQRAVASWRTQVLAAFPCALAAHTSASSSSRAISSSAAAAAASSSAAASAPAKRKRKPKAEAGAGTPISTTSTITSTSSSSAAALPEATLAFAAAVGVPPADAAHMCARFPYLLRRDPQQLAAAAAALGALLSAPGRAADLARFVLLHNPQLLTQDPAAWEGRVAALAARLNQPRDQVIRMARFQPTLLFQDPDGVVRKVEALAALLAVELPRAARIAAMFPSLALMTPATLAAKLDALRATLALPSREAAVRLCISNPLLIILAADRVAASHAAWEAAAAGTGHAGAWRTAPLLLTTASHRTVGRWALLKRLSRRHAPWAAWMGSGRGVGTILFRNQRLWRRAEFLVEQMERDPAAGKGGGGGSRRGGGSAAAAEGQSAPGEWPGAPDSFRQLLIGWTDEEFEAWQPGFLKWREDRDRREARDAKAAAGKKGGVGG
jgi:hypothetical protein